MRWYLVAALCLAGALAKAEVPAATPAESEKVPQSIWQVAPDGTATHLQSTLVCAPEVGDFRQTKLIVYDAVGFDVSCNYRGRHGWITIYLTRLGDMSLPAAFDDAKRQLVQATPDAVPLPDADQKTFTGAETYRHLIYSEKNGTLWSGIWMTDFSGWMFEFRASYAPQAQQKMFDEMAELTRRATAAAGAHLALCAKSPVPVRDGKPAADSSDTLATALLFGTVAMASSVPVQNENGKPDETLTPKNPGTWCAEEAVESANVPMLLWRSVNDKGETDPFDRLTVSTYGPSPVLESRISDIGVLLDGASKEPKYAAVLNEGDEVLIFAVFNGRPKPEELARVMKSYLDGHANPVAKVNTKTNNITIFQDPK